MGKVSTKGFKPKVRVGRFTSNTHGDGVSIEVVDAVSGIEVLELLMTTEQFGHLLGTNQEGEAESATVTEHLNLIGANWATKREKIVIPQNLTWETTSDFVAAAIRTHEVDGWHRLQERSDTEGFTTNHHHFTRKDGVSTYTVRFGRYEDDDGKPIL